MMLLNYTKGLISRSVPVSKHTKAGSSIWAQQATQRNLYAIYVPSIQCSLSLCEFLMISDCNSDHATYIYGSPE